MRFFTFAAPPALPRSLPALIVTVLMGLGIVGFCCGLWPEWRQNPDLSHGFLAPVVFLLLLSESRRTGTRRWLVADKRGYVVETLALLASIAAFALAGLFAAAVGWSHALVLFLSAAALVALLAAGILILADERIRVIPFNWISFTAILLWILVAPLPTGTYARLTLTLQGGVTSGVIEVLQFLGIPARQHGNVIELARTTVGVEEACSGVRSLISCVYAGFFFAAWQVQRAGSRALLIILAPILAMAANFIRSLTLTLLANGGVDISGTWHDVTGYAILALTAAVLAWLAHRLERPTTTPPAPSTATVTAPAPPARALGFTTGCVGLAALAFFFYAHSRPTDGPSTGRPELAAIIPAEAPGWAVRTATDLYQFSGVLQTEQLFQRTYLRNDAAGLPVDFTVYVAYWPAGQTSVSRVASHTPDACWPGSGWIAQPNSRLSRTVLPTEGFAIEPAEYRVFQTENGYRQNVWFWHVFDGRVIDYRDPYSLSALLDLALRYGFRRQGSQYFIRISSNRPWDELARDPLVREVLSRLKQTGI